MLCAMKMESVQNKEKLYELCIKQKASDAIESGFHLVARLCQTPSEQHFLFLAVVSLAGAAWLSICFPETDFCHFDDAASSKQTIKPRSTPASKPSLVRSWSGFQAHTP